MLWKKIVIPTVCCLALTAGALLLQAQVSLSESWIRFPDGSVQTTAAGNCLNPANPDDRMVRVGGVCIDKYEASVWSSPTGGIQYGVVGDDYPCSNDGQDCDFIYARSVPGVTPSRYITWFQAQAALANSNKRLPTNAEWQMAVRGTPDSTACNVDHGNLEPTGFNPSCVSSRGGHHDMVGNLSEWVADWADKHLGVASLCANLASSGDRSCYGLGKGDTSTWPGALFRGGSWNDGTEAGPRMVSSSSSPSSSYASIGFRGAR